MEENLDIRWKQRFANFKKALGQLTEFIEKGSLNKFPKYKDSFTVLSTPTNWRGIC